MNSKVRDEMGQFSIEGKLKRKWEKWFGHVVRMGENRKLRKIMQARPEG